MGNINPDPFTTRPEIEGTFGVATSTHWIASAVGMATLEKGGNAFDAGVATAFTLQVVEPHLNGPGGDVPIIVHDVKRGRTEVICGQGPAPAGATIAHYRSEGLEMVPGTGLLAACVPGTFESWMLLLRDYGTLRLRDVLEPAIGYARDGYPLVERACATIATVEQLFRKHWPTSAAVYLPNNEVPKPGTLFTNKKLVRNLCADSAGSRKRRRRPRRADRTRPQGVVAWFRRRGDRHILPHPGGHGRQRIAASRRAPRRRHGALAGHRRGAADLRLRPLHRLQGRGLEPGAGDAAATGAAQGLRARRPRSGRTGIHPPAGRMRQARVCRSREVLRRSEVQRNPDRDAAVRCLQRCAPQADLGPGIAGFRSRLGRRFRIGGEAAPPGGPSRSGRRHGRGRADRRPVRRSARRHRAFRHHRPGRQHDLGDAVGRLAAILAGDSGSRVLPRQPGPDVLARGRSSRRAGAGQAPAHHAQSDHGAARRRAVPGVGIARRRPAGPMDHAVLPAPRPRRHESAGGDRCAGLAFGAFPDFVLAAHGAARRAGGREPRAESDASKT